MQNHYNLIYREEEREMIPQCIDQGVGVIPWSPLARGLLAGNRTRDGERLTTRAKTDAFGDSLYKPELDFDVIDRADEVAAARGVPTGQVALAWLLQRPGVTAPIIGATQARAPRGRARGRAAFAQPTRRSSASRSPTSRTRSPVTPSAPGAGVAPRFGRRLRSSGGVRRVPFAECVKAPDRVVRHGSLEEG